MYKKNYIKNKEKIIKNLNGFYKNSCYFLNDKELIKILSKNNDISNFISKLKNIIQIIYNKNIKNINNNNLNKILYLKYQLI